MANRMTDGISRRNCLRAGLLGIGGMTLSDLFRWQAALIRSCAHDEADHFAGHRRFLSGYGKLKPGFGYESYYPQVGAVANRLLQGRHAGMLPAVSVGGVVVNGPDYAVTTLINDLYDRGLDRRVLLVVTGEFGRTPRLEFKDGRIGRDHWPGAMSILMSGGGIRTGQVIGATDRQGAAPSRDRFDPHDVLATIYHHLGIDPHLHIPDPAGRPIALTHGTPITSLWS